MLGYKTIVIYTSYPKSISYGSLVLEGILSADVVEVRDEITDSTLALLDPAIVASEVTKKYAQETNEEFHVHRFTPGTTHKPFRRII
ncbi:hypothetical protein UFOVP53_52 [uncultured Caudovirales phage]|uniref:Uncharacterized protein n=1 Tax=uncultured Caudovirales phage TaxID=2100421 RepID=A0A6J5KXR9_9CAUD|nr:hypothetical protein UFOVP53_52 [uncultured Caudovirales phage]